MQFKFRSDNFENPSLQTHYAFVEALALDRDAPDDINDFTSKYGTPKSLKVFMFVPIRMANKAVMSQCSIMLITLVFLLLGLVDDQTNEYSSAL